MKRTNFRNFFVLINVQDFSIRLCSRNNKAAEITGYNRNSIGKITARTVHGDWVIIPIKEE